jgi:CO/xanthine dehydrogenase FAD-binding subunit
LNVEQALTGKAGSDTEIAAAAKLTGDGIEAGADLHASAVYRLHLAANYAARAIRAALSRTV